jgi:phosphoglycolate phosphatase
MKAYQLMIFDWDGTLMDSVDRIVSCMQSAGRDCGLVEPSRDAVKQIIGLSLATAMPILFPAQSESTYHHVRELYSRYYKFDDPTPTPLFPGIEAMLRQLAGYKSLAVATGKSRAGLERVLQVTQLGEVFVARRGADDAASKPDPLMLTQIVQELGIPVSDAVMIGDSVHDLAMAAALGMDRIGVSWGVDNKATLARYEPILIADSVTQLAERLAL